MLINFLDTVPYWGVYVGLLLLFVISIEAGFRLGLRERPKADVLNESRKAQAGTVLGALLALVSFLLAFTFGMAGSQFDARRHLVIDHANAIGTTFLRAAHLPEPHGSKSRRLLLEYVAHRHVVDEETSSELMASSAMLETQLWDEVTAVTKEDRTPVVSIYIQSLNEMIDLNAKRGDIVFWTRIPGMLFATLAFLSILVMVLTGYWLGWTGKRHIFPTTLLIVTYATAFLLVIDLDRPQGGFFRVSQQPMIELSESMHASEKHQPN